MIRAQWITWIFLLIGCQSMAYGVEKYCVDLQKEETPAIMIRNAGSKEALREIGTMMEAGTITAHSTNDSNEKHFIFETLSSSSCIILKNDETLELTVNQKKTLYIPFLNINEKDFTAEYGLIEKKHINSKNLIPFERKTSTQEILDYKTDLDATVVYVTCPANRDELCTLRIKHKGAWHEESGKIFEMKVLARSRRERGEQHISQRLVKDGDTPQGIYHLWGTLFTTDTKFGNVPRIDIDGMQPPINFMHALSPNFSRIMPKKVFLDYWIHEFPLAFAMGRYLLRIHDNSTDPQFPDTYTTPKSKQTFRASAGCINTGNQMETLLKILRKLDVLSKDQIKTNTHYGRLDSPNVRNAFLVVIDQ